MTERDDSAHLRVSDADRHRVAEVLRDAAGEGRLDLDELDERLEAAYAARVYADLVPILADLPTGGLEVSGPAPPVPARPRQPATDSAPRHDTSLAIMGGQDRRNVWEVGPRHNAFVLMGGVGIDLRQAVFAAPEVVINANVVMGAIDVVVNAHTKVVVEGFGIMGSFDQERDKVPPETGPDSPTVRVRGVALMGAVSVVRKAMPEEERRKRLPR